MEQGLLPRRIVVKVGTSTLTRDTGSLNLHNMDHLARVLSDLKGMGHEIVLVSSGAIAIGTRKLRMEQRPDELRGKQAVAAVGQCMMMHVYDKLFSEYNRTVAQILLTGEDVDAPVRSAHLHNTFEALLELGVIPVVNENDSISSFELEALDSFGDNDTLSAVIAALIGADLLILLSDIDGLFTDDPNTNPDAKFIDTVEKLDEKLKSMGKGPGSKVGTGGMATKLTAAEIATAAGADMVIANGGDFHVIHKVMEGRNYGTLFVGNQKEEFYLIDYIEKLL